MWYKITPTGKPVTTNPCTLDVVLEDRGFVAAHPGGEFFEVEEELDKEDLEDLALAGFVVKKVDGPSSDEVDRVDGPPAPALSGRVMMTTIIGLLVVVIFGSDIWYWFFVR